MTDQQRRPDPYQAREIETKFAELKAREARAEVDALATRLGGRAITPLEGKTSVDVSTHVEGDMMAFAALRNVADQIVQRVKATSGKLVLARDEDVRALLEYRVFFAQMDQIERTFTLPPKRASAVTHELIGSPIVGATALATGVVNLLALFRTDTRIAGRELTLDDITLAALLTNALATNKLCVPALYPLELQALGPDQSLLDKIIKSIAKLRELQQEVRGSGSEDPSIERAHQLLSQIEAMVLGRGETALVGAGSGEQLRAILRGGALASLLDDGGRLLYLRIVRVVGSTRTDHKLIGKDVLSHSGGAIVTFFLIDGVGNVVDSDACSHWTGDVRSRMDETTARLLAPWIGRS